MKNCIICGQDMILASCADWDPIPYWKCKTDNHRLLCKFSDDKLVSYFLDIQKYRVSHLVEADKLYVFNGGIRMASIFENTRNIHLSSVEDIENFLILQ